MTTKKDSGHVLPHVNRRAFIKASGAVVGCALASTLVPTQSANALSTDNSQPDLHETDAGVDTKFSICLMCHSNCGFKARIDRASGVLLKVDGNPYHPNCAEADTRLPFSTPVAVAAVSQAGTLCPKGQAMLETVYNPNRITTPLRRVAARGAGQWESITWGEALDEIASKLAPFAQRLDASGVYVGKYLDPQGNWIDTNDFGLGPVANQVVLSHGRIQHGQKEFTDRFWKTGFGTVNYRGDHTSICETSHHIAGDLVGVSSAGKGAKHLKPDIANSEYIIWFGTNPAEAGFPTQTLAKKIARRVATARDVASENFEMVVVDPRFSNTAKLADKWLPVKPGGDAALALGMARRIIESGTYNATFLTAASRAAGSASYNNFCNATWLVWGTGASAGRFVDAAAIGGTPGNKVVVVGGVQTEVDPWGATAVIGTLEPGSQSVGGEVASTAFELLVARTREKSINGWASLCGIAPADIIEVADKFAAAGTKAVASGYRGPCQHTNGTYASLSWHLLNTLVGNYDQKGGHIKGGSHLHEDGSVANQLLIAGIAGSGYGKARSASGVPISRMKKDFFAHQAAYPAYAAYEPTRPRRPWFPLASNDNYQETLAGIADGYPYPVEVLITYWNDWAYSTPAGKSIAMDALRDEGKVPFFVAVDIEFGETSALADIILPECTFLERWSTPHVGPTVLTKTSGFRQPVVGSVAADGTYTTIFNTTPADPTGPRNIEDILIDLGQRIQAKVRTLGSTADYTNFKFAGIGAGAWNTTGLSANFTPDLFRAYDYYTNLLENFAIEAGGGVTSADIEARGGWFADASSDYIADGSPKGKFNGFLWNIYVEKLATSRDSMTGLYYDPLPRQDPVMDALGNLVDDLGFPFIVVTYKDMFHAMARTAVNPTLMALQPENPIWMSSSDARAFGISTGDNIRVWSKSHPMGEIGKAWVTERIRPGVIAIAHSYGHWEMGSKAHVVDGVSTGDYPSRGAGTAMNPLLRVDDSIGNVCLQDPIGGSSSFYDTRVQVERI